MTIDYSGLPDHLRTSMQSYIEQGVRPGHFLTAVLENNLLESFKRADGTCVARMHRIVTWLYNELPGNVWGSPAMVEAHLQKRHDALHCVCDVCGDEVLLELTETFPRITGGNSRLCLHCIDKE